MLDPRYIDDMPASIVALYRQAEDAILQDMARKLDAYDYWMPAVEWQNQKLRQAGELQETIISELAKISKKSEEELRRLMSDAGSLALKLDAEVYDNAGLQVPDFNMSEPLRKVLNAGYQQTAGTMRNLTRSTATAAQQQFFDAADLAWAKVQSGAIDYTTAIRDAIKSLADKGIASISYPGGHKEYMDVAVRRAVVTGINQTACKLSEELADELECDLVEVSAHAGARPSHAEWQGGIYSRSGKSEKYPDFRTSTGYGTGAGLGGWNCRHSFGPYVEGSPRIWSEKELEKLNAKDYEYNGEKLTEYEATQQQRYFERQIRKAKREEIALEAAGQDASEAKARVEYYQKKQADFLDQTGLKRQYERENVYKISGNANKREKLTFPEYTPAKTIKEAEEFAGKYVTTGGFGSVGLSYSGVHIDVANSINNALQSFYSVFDIPNLGGLAAPAKNTKLGKIVHANAAYSPIRQSLLLDRNKTKSASGMLESLTADKDAIAKVLANPERYNLAKMDKQVLAVINASKTSGRGLVPETIEEAVWHELGHHMERSITKDEFSLLRKTKAEYGDGISGYAAAGGVSEYIAESTASFLKGEAIKDPEMAKIFDRLRKRK